MLTIPAIEPYVAISRFTVWPAALRVLPGIEGFKVIAEEQKEIEVEQYVDDRVGLDKVQDSFLRLTNGQDDAIKIIIHPN